MERANFRFFSRKRAFRTALGRSFDTALKNYSHTARAARAHAFIPPQPSRKLKRWLDNLLVVVTLLEREGTATVAV